MTICGNRLLIVEDEPLLRITIADALRKEGWTVEVAEDGVKCASLFEQHLHDVVLTDLVMPGMGGMDLLRRCKAIQPETWRSRSPPALSFTLGIERRGEPP